MEPWEKFLRLSFSSQQHSWIAIFIFCIIFIVDSSSESVCLGETLKFELFFYLNHYSDHYSDPNFFS